MKFWLLLNILLLFVFPASAQAETQGWKTYHSEYGFEVKYPDTLTVNQATGNSCVKTTDKPEPVCTPTKSFSLGGVSADKKSNSVGFFIQSGNNPKQLPIEQWYQSQPVKPAKTDITIDGKPAIQIEHNGTFGVSHMVYVSINGTDILTITYTSTNSQFDETYRAILSTVKFSQTIK